MVAISQSYVSLSEFLVTKSHVNYGATFNKFQFKLLSTFTLLVLFNFKSFLSPFRGILKSEKAVKQSFYGKR